MKKAITLIMAAMLAFTILSATAFAQGGRGIGNDRTLGKITFIMVDSENTQNVLASFTTEAQIGRFRAVAEKNIPGWRIDRRAFRNAVRADRGARTITVPMVRDAEISNVNFGISG